MDTTSKVRCPFLPVTHFHDNLVVSSLSNAIGSVVEFVCSGGDILSGSSILQCLSSGNWNGTIPTCINENATQASITSVSGADGSSTLPPTASPAELEVETVLIILWVTGGLLLVTLVILMTCILMTHKKRQRTRSQRCSPRAQGNPRHGGVNPTFSNYDEIWTWIPVVNGNTDNCQNGQNSASARESSATQTNRELMRNLRLPSYNEAIREGPTGSRNNNQSQVVAQRQNVIQTNTASHTNAQRQMLTQIIENRNNRTNAARSTQVQRNPVVSRENRCQSQTGNVLPRYHIRVDTHTSGNSAEQHHYETIPADLHRDSTIRNNIENTTNVRVTTSSALQQARDLVNQFGAHAHRPLSHVPSGTRATVEGANSRDSNWHLAARGNPPAIEQRRPAQDSRAQVHRSTQNYQRSSYGMQDFRHSEGSVFEYYSEGERQTRSHIPSSSTTTNDLPPPYSVSREFSSQGGNSNSGQAASRSSATAAASSMRTGFESQYF